LIIAERWTWNHSKNEFSGLSLIGNRSMFSANEEDFVSRYPNVDALLTEHDSVLGNVNELGKVLFQKVAGTSFIREVFA
jgi:hypothetical protein